MPGFTLTIGMENDMFYADIEHKYDLGNWDSYFTLYIKLKSDHSIISEIKTKTKKQAEEIVKMIDTILKQYRR